MLPAGSRVGLNVYVSDHRLLRYGRWLRPRKTAGKSESAWAAGDCDLPPIPRCLVFAASYEATNLGCALLWPCRG